jgi:hypothetical protein
MQVSSMMQNADALHHAGELNDAQVNSMMQAGELNDAGAYR